MRTRPRLSVEVIVDTALKVLDDEGLDNLTTTNVARRLGVTQPALYSHMASLDELRRAVATRGAQELSALVRQAVQGKEADDALYAMAHAYREYVRRHPDRYLLQLSAPRSSAYSRAMERAAEAVRGVLRSYGLAEDQVREAHVAFRAAVHGFVHLEARDALPARPARANDHFDSFLALFAAGLRAIAPPQDARRGRRGR
jgi:AcrR family transcriptional regulator